MAGRDVVGVMAGVSWPLDRYVEQGMLIAVPVVEVPPFVGKDLEALCFHGSAQFIPVATWLDRSTRPIGMGTDAKVIELTGHRDFPPGAQIVESNIHGAAAIVA